MSGKRTGCGDRYKHWCVTGFPTRYFLACPHKQMASRFAGNVPSLWRWLRSFASVMGVVEQERQCTNMVSPQNPWRQTALRNTPTLDMTVQTARAQTQSALKCHTKELGDKWQIQRWLLLCPSGQMQPLILPWTLRSDPKEVGRSPFLPFVIGQRKSPFQKPFKSLGFVSPSQHIPGLTVANKPNLLLQKVFRVPLGHAWSLGLCYPDKHSHRAVVKNGTRNVSHSSSSVSPFPGLLERPYKCLEPQLTRNSRLPHMGIWKAL